MPIHRSNSAKYTSGATHFANLQALSKSALRLDAARPITVMSEPDQALTLAPQQSCSPEVPAARKCKLQQGGSSTFREC